MCKIKNEFKIKHKYIFKVPGFKVGNINFFIFFYFSHIRDGLAPTVWNRPLNVNHCVINAITKFNEISVMSDISDILESSRLVA